MSKYCIVDQWHSMAETWDELAHPEQHRGDAAEVNKLWSFKVPDLLDAPPPYLGMGRVCLEVHDDGTLSVHSARYDTSG